MLQQPPSGAAYVPPPAPSYLAPSQAVPAWGAPGAAQPALGKGLAVALSIVIGLSLVVELLAAFTAGPQDIRVENINGRVQTFDDTDGVLGILAVPLSLACTVLGLVWVGMAYGATKRLTGMPGSPAWAVWSWIIPLANLVLPYFPLNRARKALRAPAGPFIGWALAYSLASLLTIVMVGWTFGAGFSAGFKLARNEATVVHLGDGFVALSIAQAVVHAIAGALFLVVVWGFQRGLARPVPPPAPLPQYAGWT